MSPDIRQVIDRQESPSMTFPDSRPAVARACSSHNVHDDLSTRSDRALIRHARAHPPPI
jgi:hypothetical protein